MRANHEQILENALAYVAQQYYKKTEKYIYQLLMYKILALVDYKCVKEIGRPCTELDYYAESRGPVPHELKNWSSHALVVKQPADNNKKAKIFKCLGEPNLDYFSDYELDLFDAIIDRAVNEKWNAKIASEISHKEIIAWGVARNRKTRSRKMNYADEFGKDIFSMPDSKLTSAELNFKLYSGLNQNA